MINPTFPATGQRARLKWLPEDPGVIIGSGPQQSIIRHDSDRRERCFPNEQFEPAPLQVKKVKAK